MFAHSTPDSSRAGWEPLADHLERVAERAARFAAPFGWGNLARAAGLLNDIGKASAAYQSYIADPPRPGRKGPDHSSAGAREAEHAYGPQAGRMIAFAVAGHHAGLADFPELDRRVREKVLEDYAGWNAAAGQLPEAKALLPSVRIRRNGSCPRAWCRSGG
jgi:CRISPR-associated endonuclease/helicase Cas3